MKYLKLAITYVILMLTGGVSAGEIFISPAPGSQSKNSVDNATANRIKAQAYTNPEVQTPSTIIVVPPEEGLLAPPTLGRPPDNRSKARNFIKDARNSTTDPTIILLDTVPKGGEPARVNLEKNLNKARGYADDGNSTGVKPGTYVRYGTAVGVVAADGVIVFSCEEISNTAGRIGDDSQSGNSFTLSVNKKLHPARCK